MAETKKATGETSSLVPEHQLQGDRPARVGNIPTAAANTPFGASHLRLIGDDDNEVSAAEIFNEPHDRNWTTANRRVRQVYRHPNTKTEVTQVLYVKGQQVSVDEAVQIKERFGGKG